MSDEKDKAMSIILLYLMVGIFALLYLGTTRYPDLIVTLGRLLVASAIAFTAISAVALLIWAIITVLSPDDEKPKNTEGDDDGS